MKKHKKLQICHLIVEKHHSHFYLLVSRVKQACYERIILVIGPDHLSYPTGPYSSLARPCFQAETITESCPPAY